MKRKAVALLLCVVLFCGALSPITAMAIGPVYTGEELVYEYPRVNLAMTQGEAPTHQMRYVNQFFGEDGAWSPQGEKLLKWLDMSVREDVDDRINSGYLLLEEEHEFQDQFWQRMGYGSIYLAEFVTTLTGVKDMLANARLMQGSAGNVSGNGSLADTSVVNFALSAMGSGEYLDIRQKTTAVYHLKLSFTEHTRELLDRYAKNRNHETAVAIINSLHMVRQLKQAGEDMISMHYLSGLAGEMGLDQLPAAGAILWSEVLKADSFMEADLDGAGYITPVWGVFENSVGKTEEEYIDSAGNSIIRYELVSTPLGFYRRGEDATVQGVRLADMPAAFAGVDETMWRVASTAQTTYVQNGHSYAAEKDASWRTGGLPAYESIDRVHKEKLYVYQRDGVEVLISAADYEVYLKIASQIARMLETYATPGTNRLDPADHQEEERLMWANITRRYIEAIEMYDPMATYP